MRAVSLHQPWSTFMAEDVKRNETRGWPAHRSMIGELFANHAAKSLPPYAKAALTGRPGIDADPLIDALAARGYWVSGVTRRGRPQVSHNLPMGAVLSIHRLLACVPMVAAPGDVACVVVAADGSAVYWQPQLDGGVIVDEITEVAFGDYQVGRWAWLTELVRKLDCPLPIGGHQGIWNLPDELIEAA